MCTNTPAQIAETRPSPPAHIVLAFAWANNNVGDAAITPGALRCLRRAFPDAALTVLSLQDEVSPAYAATQAYLAQTAPDVRVLPHPLCFLPRLPTWLRRSVNRLFGLVSLAMPGPMARLFRNNASYAALLAADLIVGISPWGSMAEEAFLTANPDAFDVLLGAGHGFGTPAMPQPAPRTLWARSHTKGKTISRLDITLPLKTSSDPWRPGENHRAELLNPDYKVPDDPDIAALAPTPTVAAAPPPAGTGTP